MREPGVRGPAVDLGEFERRLRAPERKGAGGDPLSELARLIQAEERPAADPYSRILAEPAQAREASVDPRPELRAELRPSLRGSYDAEPEPQYADEHPGYFEPAVEHDEYAAEHREPQAEYHGEEGRWNEDAQYLDYGEESERYEEPRARSWFRPWHAVAGISLLAIASIGWGFAHRGGGDKGKEIATIAAPEGPVKVKPTAETEAQTPDTGSAVLDRKESEPVKQIVTNQEQAVEPTLVPKDEPRTLTLGNGPVAGPHEAALPPPKKVKSVTVRPDGTRVEDAEALPPAVSKATRPPEMPAAAPPKPPAPPKVVKPKPAPKPPAPKVAAVPEEEVAAPAPSAPDDAAAAEPAAPVTKGGYAVQFGAATTEAEASALVKSVSAKYGASLGGHRPGFAKAVVGDKTVFRVRVSGVSKESAAAICGKVKSSGGSCFVAGN